MNLDLDSLMLVGLLFVDIFYATLSYFAIDDTIDDVTRRVCLTRLRLDRRLNI